jgi:preprotein translocase subunit SecY
LDPDDLSEQLKRQGASIPLVRPGKSTAAYIKTVSSYTNVDYMLFFTYDAHIPTFYLILLMWDLCIYNFKLDVP